MVDKTKKCPICGNTELIGIKTKISDFIKERIKYEGEDDIELLHCTGCSFAFYNYRFSQEQQEKLYSGYRDDVYQQQREKHEYWYTAKVNDLLNHDMKSLTEQQRIIDKVLIDNNLDAFDNALDYGGNEGETFLKKWGEKNKYLFDISGCQTLPGIIGINRIDDLYNLQLDFVMCNMVFEHLANVTEVMNVFTKIGDNSTVFYIEVPSEFPFDNDKFSIKNNMGLLMNPNFSNWKLLRYYLKQRMGSFMPMKEHINFFSPTSLKAMVENSGFATIDIQENEESGALGRGKVLSVLFKRKS